MSEKELEKKRMIKWALFLPTGVVGVALAEGFCRISSPNLRKLVFWRPLIYVTLMMNMIAVDEFVARYKLITDPDPEFTHSPELRKIGIPLVLIFGYMNLLWTSDETCKDDR
eukprot:621144_1